MELPIIQNRKYFFALSVLLIILSFAAVALFGLRFSIEFTGGSKLMVRFLEEAQSGDAVKEKLAAIEGLGEVHVQPAPENTFVIRSKALDEEMHQKTLEELRELGAVEELEFSSIGPTIGKELRQKGIAAVFSGLLAIMLFIAWAFRHASRPVRSWQYGAVVAAVGLLHDVLIPVGVMAALGQFFGMEIGAPFIAAILTVLGFSVHDTIVVFDRTRENLRRFAREPFEKIVNISVNQTLGRSLNTSLTLLFVVAALWLFAGASLQGFAAVILVGTIIGTYSSIFVASPLLVEISRFKLPRRRRV